MTIGDGAEAVNNALMEMVGEDKDSICPRSPERKHWICSSGRMDGSLNELMCLYCGKKYGSLMSVKKEENR